MSFDDPPSAKAAIDWFNGMNACPPSPPALFPLSANELPAPAALLSVRLSAPQVKSSTGSPSKSPSPPGGPSSPSGEVVEVEEVGAGHMVQYGCELEVT